MIPDELRDERLCLRSPDQTPNILAHVMAYARALPLVVARTVLDMGCGTGYGTKLLAEAAQHVVGVDYSRAALAYAQRGGPPNCTFEWCDLDKDPPHWTPDVVTCFQALEHIKDPGALIRRFHCQWIFAVPNGGADIVHHHHNVTSDLIQDWFEGRATLAYFDDEGHFFQERPAQFTNFFGVYTP